LCVIRYFYVLLEKHQIRTAPQDSSIKLEEHHKRAASNQKSTTREQLQTRTVPEESSIKLEEHHKEQLQTRTAPEVSSIKPEQHHKIAASNQNSTSQEQNQTKKAPH
jgi:hypothetical protein